jgi:phosphatidylinositol-3,4,5-trisphosphate 3-phosphatase/dual-specificity protein phosphatase PTEN
VYNLCSERSYDPAKFDNNVVRYPFDDHNPCPFEVLDRFCADVHHFLAKHPQNIAAVHCKAGKGRTGLMIGAYMLYTQVTRRARPCCLYGTVRWRSRLPCRGAGSCSTRPAPR